MYVLWTHKVLSILPISFTILSKISNLRAFSCICIVFSMITFLIFIQIILVFCEYMPEYDSMMVGNLRRREQIPLNQLNRRFNGGDLNYRRTKDIRDIMLYKKYQAYLQMSELQKAEKFNEEAKDDLEKLQRELKWFTVDENNGIDS